MSQVDFDLFALCAAHRVDERALEDALNAILSVGHTPTSIETLSELARYSPRHMYRILRVLRYSANGIVPIVEARGGKRGRGLVHRYSVNANRVQELGLFQHAA